ncbi:hypothetical protein NCCP2716_27520 [Sporosarcina sp. NCCP-2716]|uniref:hypothetical protein n=1 Tax=Sporosarcina sp. NCCP-2716 TaxID=2943679 RepID=UPI0020405D02|nr:hypothetical protein [Sporosarcina sp. NCCP-2716]GKV70254.1 hypothetical protein NCCP2716_27520 [Sporosarcina sp. NCCP-2716]
MTAETNEERLDRIKRNWGSDIQENWESVDGQEIDWLIQQAERAKDLEGENSYLIRIWDKKYASIMQENPRLQKEIQSMRHRILKVCNNVGAFPKATVKDYVQGVFKDYLPGRKAE